MYGRGSVMIPSAAVAVLLALAGWVPAQKPGDAMEEGFKNPPEAAKPRTWWHWMGGNVTAEGITLDLEWMKRVGLGGIQLFDAGLGVGQHVAKRVVFMSPEWKQLLRHAAAECDRLGLEMTMHSSAGWSLTGGPWVKPEQAMKKLVWSETRVEGPRRYTGRLPQPPSVNGPFQNLPSARGFGGDPKAPPDPTYYADSAVIAYRVPAEEVRMVELRPKVTTSAGSAETGPLFDGDLTTTMALPIPEGGGRAWIQLEFAQPFPARAFSLAAGGRGIPNGEVRASEDGVNFRTLLTLPGAAHEGARLPVRTYAFPETMARFYRVELTSLPAGRGFFGPGRGVPPPKQYELAEIEFHSGARVNRWQDKANFALMFEYESAPTPAAPPAAVIARSEVIDLTAKMDPEGRLDWEVPAGRWEILRLGYSLTGAKNRPAVPEGTGFEVDKLSRKHVEAYFRAYVDPVAEALGPLFGRSFRYLLMDSWEAGVQNWTEDMAGEFRRRRGYDPTPYLPVLTGRVVESADVSDRFLWDFRRTLADLVADHHYGVFAELARGRGIRIYSEAAGISLPMMQDALQNKGRVDIPMGEFWTQYPAGNVRAQDHADLREAASGAHIYGKKLVGAESFTTGGLPGWAQPPSYLKWLGDYALANGINRIIFHTSAHQPFKDRKPGMTLGPFGQHFNRNMTWAEIAGPFVTYLSRSMYLLQQGLFVADLCYYYGEGAPAAVPYWEAVRPQPPQGYDYDFLNTEVLLERMSVKDGRLVLPDGMSYRVLVLPETDRMTLPVLRKIRELVAAGATVVGPKPTRSPSLAGFPGVDAEVRALANEVWGDTDGRSRTRHAYGKGQVVWGQRPEEVLAGLGVPRDFEYTRPKMETLLLAIHRRAGDTDIYFVSNQRERTEEVEARFRVGGKAAELWHPDTGVIEPAEYVIDQGRTTVPLRLDPFGSVFVVFRQPAAAASRRLPRTVSTPLGTVAGTWDVSFPPNWGAPAKIRLERLASWTEHSDAGVKYFSGTATYSKDVTAPRAWFRPGARLVLDLGQVKELAEVVLNGKPLGVLWKPPYQVDVTGALRPGVNRLEIRITNLWPNRIIGDQLLPEEKRYTFTTAQTFGSRMGSGFTKDSPLLESGLLGPVTVSAVSMK